MMENTGEALEKRGSPQLSQNLDFTHHPAKNSQTSELRSANVRQRLRL